ncbi:MAG: hypothetical protein IPF79_08905 [Ignavibacteria bacterium]|nr:hypothetical protein [Ignavibacteria bacterium]
MVVQQVIDMARKQHTKEQIIGILLAAEVIVSKGGTVEALCRDQKITKAPFTRLVFVHSLHPQYLNT